MTCIDNTQYNVHILITEKRTYLLKTNQKSIQTTTTKTNVYDRNLVLSVRYKYYTINNIRVATPSASPSSISGTNRDAYRIIHSVGMLPPNPSQNNPTKNPDQRKPFKTAWVDDVGSTRVGCYRIFGESQNLYMCLCCCLFAHPSLVLRNI